MACDGSTLRQVNSKLPSATATRASSATTVLWKRFQGTFNLIDNLSFRTGVRCAGVWLCSLDRNNSALTPTHCYFSGNLKQFIFHFSQGLLSPVCLQPDVRAVCLPSSVLQRWTLAQLWQPQSFNHGSTSMLLMWECFHHKWSNPSQHNNVIQKAF